MSIDGLVVNVGSGKSLPDPVTDYKQWNSVWETNFNTALNISSELPILESMETTSFNVFFDVANVWGVDYSSAINDSSAIRSATGIGIDWYTPVGPLSFTLSQPIAQKSTDKTESFRFNLGTTF